jgi:acid phosphatase
MLVCSLLVLGVAVGCAKPVKQPPTYRRNVALWASESAEFTAVALQTYATAQRRLVDALADPTWTASVEQTEDYEDLPPAIIVDLDETVLDNRPFQMGLIREGIEFDEAAWNAWIQQASVEAIPGALGFLQHAHRLGVEIFYVTNRSHVVEDATRRNLEKLGLPVNEELDTVLTKYEQPQWTREKSNRRKLIRGRYRVLLILGDNLGDFVTERRFSRGGRRQTVIDHQEMWGTKWFMLPNPLYGGWVSATIEERDKER